MRRARRRSTSRRTVRHELVERARRRPRPTATSSNDGERVEIARRRGSARPSPCGRSARARSRRPTAGTRGAGVVRPRADAAPAAASCRSITSTSDPGHSSRRAYEPEREPAPNRRRVRRLELACDAVLVEQLAQCRDRTPRRDGSWSSTSSSRAAVSTPLAMAALDRATARRIPTRRCGCATRSSTGTTQTLPSPILPVRAVVDERLDHPVDVGVVARGSRRCTFGTKSTVYSAPRYTSVWPRWRPKPWTSETVSPCDAELLDARLSRRRA